MNETPDSLSSHKGITNIFARSRNRDPSKRSSAHGSIRSFGSDNNNNVLGLRRSIDALNDVANAQEDEEAHGVKKLVDKTIGRRKRKKQEAADERLACEEAERGRSIVERGTLKDDVDVMAFTFDAKGNTSQSSLLTLDDEPTTTTARYVTMCILFLPCGLQGTDRFLLLDRTWIRIARITRPTIILVLAKK